MPLFEHPEFKNHQEVHFFEDKKVGLKSIIAIHRLIEGTSGGGCRFYPYPSSSEALTDVLRLSRAMTYKFVLAGIAIGGAKTVIIGNPKTDKTTALLESFGRMVNSLGGKFVTGSDVGTNEEDMTIIRRSTRHVVGVKGEGGDTSRITGYGVYQSIRAAVRFKYGQDHLRNIRVAIQGGGGVGRHLAKHLLEAGAEIYLADIDPMAIERAKKLGVRQFVDPDEILIRETDILAPCALGGILNPDSIPNIKADIIAGGANNPLAKDADAEFLKSRDILFVPDFISNSGGVIHGTGQSSGKTEEEIIDQANGIYDTTIKILEMGRDLGISPIQAAYQLAEQTMAQED